MNSEKDKLGVSECFRLCRQVLDGASFEWLAERGGRSRDEIAEAWEYGRAKLSAHFAEESGKETRLLSDDELRSQSERCLRLLLEWQERADLFALLPAEHCGQDEPD